jgi:hypothetical protein
MTSPAYDICYYIRNVIGKGTALGEDIMCNFMPAEGSNVIAVFAYGGSPSNRGMGHDTGALENGNLQIGVRHADSEAAEQTARDIHRHFDELSSNVTINGNVYTWLHPLQPPLLLERTAHAVTFSFNVEVQMVRA